MDTLFGVVLLWAAANGSAEAADAVKQVYKEPIQQNVETTPKVSGKEEQTVVGQVTENGFSPNR